MRQIINHPEFNKEIGAPGDNDIAILKLDFPLIFNSDVQPACLPDPYFAPDESKGTIHLLQKHIFGLFLTHPSTL